MLVAALHLVIGLIGAVLLYVALFLRETEEGKLQNRLEKLWVEIDDLSKAAVSKHTAFLKRISASTSFGLDRLFGVRLFSAGAASASVCFSVGSIFLFWASVFLRSHQAGHAYHSYLLPSFIVGVLSLIVGLLPVPYRYLGFLWFVIGMVIMVYADWDLLDFDWTSDWELMKKDFLPIAESWLLLAVSFLSDVLFIAISRWCVRRSSDLDNGWHIAFLLILNGCLGVFLISPIFWWQKLLATPADESALGYGSYVLFLGASNLVDGAISALFILLALTALAHLAIWPIMERPIYSLQRFGLTRSPKLLAATSVTCLMFAWPHSPVIQAITKLVHG